MEQTIERPAEGLEIREPCQSIHAAWVFRHMRDEDRPYMPDDIYDWLDRIREARRTFSIMVHGELFGVGCLWDHEGVRLLTVTQPDRHSPAAALGGARLMSDFFKWVDRSEGDRDGLLCLMIPTALERNIRMVERAGLVRMGDRDGFTLLGWR